MNHPQLPQLDPLTDEQLDRLLLLFLEGMRSGAGNYLHSISNVPVTVAMFLGKTAIDLVLDDPAVRDQIRDGLHRAWVNPPDYEPGLRVFASNAQGGAL